MSRALVAEPNAIQLGAGFDFTAPDSPLAPYYLRGYDVAAVLLLSLVYVLTSVSPLPRAEVRLQLELGMETLRNGPWAMDSTRQLSWLFPTGLAVIFRLGSWLSGANSPEGGVECLRAVYAWMVMARLALLWLAFRKVSHSAGMAFVGLLLMLGLSLGRAPHVQPFLFGEVCFSALLLLLSNQELTRTRIKCLCGMFVLWANIHESFVLGFVLLIIALFARSFQPRSGLFQDVFLRQLMGLILVCAILVLLLNPRGPFLLDTLWKLANNPAFLALDAWQPLRFDYGPGGQWTFVLLWGLVVIMQHMSRCFYPPLQLLCLLVFGFWPLWHMQILLEWAMIAPWCIMTIAPAAAARFRPHWLPASVPSFRKTIIAAMFVAIALTWFAPLHWLMGGRPAPLSRSLTQTIAGDK